MILLWPPEKRPEFTRNFILRVAAALPEDGLAFDSINWLDARLHWPEQSHRYGSSLRRALRAGVEQGLVVFRNGRYSRARRLHMMPLPPLKLPGDKSDPVWPEMIAQ